MSYILEALRKAEQERSLGRIPDLETVYAQLPSPRRRRIWLWLLLALVLIGNTMALVMLVPQRESHQTGLLSTPATTTPRPVPSAAQVPPDVSSPSPQTASAKVQTRKRAPTAENRFSMARPTASLHQPESLSENSTTGAVKTSSSVAMASPAQLQKPESSPPSAKANDTKDTTLSSPIALSAPTVLSELPEALQRTIPTLNLDIHVYHEMPGRSFVVINSRRYQAGVTLQEGPFLEKITADGVVLTQQGNRFLLPVHR